MNVRVLLFAAAREKAGTDALELDVEDGATVATLLARLGVTHPDLGPVLPACRTAVDEAFASAATPLTDGCTVAVLPPVSGG
jgi:molybdopterin converting factor subunit 1